MAGAPISSGAEDSPQHRSRPGGRSARVAKAVFNATLELLAERGMGAVTIEEVARIAGVHKTTVYRRWNSATELVVAALQDRSDELVPLPDTGDIREDLRLHLTQSGDSMGSEFGRALVMATSGDPSPELEDVRTRYWTSRFQQLRAIVERGVNRGELRHDVDPDLLIEVVVAPLFFRLLMTRRPITRAFERRIVDLVLDGALPSPHLAATPNRKAVARQR